MRTASLTAAVAAACLLAACGQKGPLVLPDAQHPRKKLSVQKPAAAPAARPATPAGGPQSMPSVPANSGNTGDTGSTSDTGDTGDAKSAPAPHP